MASPGSSGWQAAAGETPVTPLSPNRAPTHSPGQVHHGPPNQEQEAAIKQYKEARKQDDDDPIVYSIRWEEGPQHEVLITKEFYLGMYEVTQKQYQAVMSINPSHFSSASDGKDKAKGLNTDDFPVDSVSWQQATQFCKKLSARPEERKAGRLYRLPTEAEWEYACRGGAASSTAFHYGNSISSTQANFTGKYPFGGGARGPYLARTCKVGSYKPNGFGLYDMHGNVEEWCSDWYGIDYYAKSPRRDPPGPAKGSGRVQRGGAWLGPGWSCRSAYRSWWITDKGSWVCGFRVAAVVAKQPRGRLKPRCASTPGRSVGASPNTATTAAGGDPSPLGEK
jgi:formylglycine-generating enzyme required for sulfatase activity